MALMVRMGEESREVKESRLLDTMEVLERERLRRKEVRMEEKERDWKRVLRMLGVILSEEFIGVMAERESG